MVAVLKYENVRQSILSFLWRYSPNSGLGHLIFWFLDHTQLDTHSR
jgi:hypothetical protein